MKSHGRCLYFVSLIYECSRKLWLYFLKTKDEDFGQFKEWKIVIEKQLDKQVKTLRADTVLDFPNNSFNDLYKIGRYGEAPHY